MTRVGDVLTEFKEPAPTGNPYTVLTLTERNGFVPQNERFKKRVALEDTTGYKVIRRDDVAFNPYLLWAGALARNTITDAGVISPLYPTFRINKDFDAGFVARLLLSDRLILAYDSIAFGSVPRRRRSSVKDFLNLPLPELPPRPEQRRIAAILDEADAIRAKRRSQLAHLDELPKALFHEMFKDDRDVAPLGSAAQFSGGGSLPESISFEDQAEGTLLMRVSDMNAPGNEKYIRNTAHWTSRATVRSTTVDGASVIIPKRGAAIATNKKRISTRRTALDPNLMGITPDPAELDVEYLYAWFCSFDLSRMVSGSSVPQLNKKDLAPLEIPLPPLQAQQVFAQETTAIRAERDRVARALEAHDELFSALQHRAFRGEL